ncbi:MAG: sulfite exporter TauE/SafE family protein [Desulfobacula sp.]|nr:sulfite exporter TauE/SafE family protein [Desulfobacula sp.]
MHGVADIISVLFISFCFILSAFTFSFAGFGFALVAVPLMAIVLPIKTAVALQFPFGLILVVYNVLKYSKNINLVKLWPFFVGAAVAAPVGFVALNWFPEAIMKQALALLIVLSILSSRLPWTEKRARHFAKSKLAGGLFGLLSGWFFGAYTIGGPPAVIYFKAKEADPIKIKGIIAIYFLVTDMFISGLLCYSGILNKEIFFQAVGCAPPAIIGSLIGVLAFKKISAKGYLPAVDILLFIAAILLCIR